MTLDRPKTVVELESVTVSINGRSILEDIDLSISPGVNTGIIGPNGGGKTTLLKVILGLIQPTRGSIRPARSWRRRLSSCRIPLRACRCASARRSTCR